MTAEEKKSAILGRHDRSSQEFAMISPEEYLEGERSSDIRHEYIDGAVSAMAGCSGGLRPPT